MHQAVHTVRLVSIEPHGPALAHDQEIRLNGGMHSLIRGLPDPATLRDRCRSMSMLDAVLSPDWEGRYYSFDSNWNVGEQLASMRDGSGNDWFMVFSKAGVYARGFDREVPNAPHLLEKVPGVFLTYVEEPAFADHDGAPLISVCFWREVTDDVWHVAAEPEASTDLFDLLADGTPESYKQWAEEYYETHIDLEAVRHVFSLRSLTPAVVTALNPEADLTDLAPDVEEIGYPK
ncbi:hypothetical protein ACMZ5F_04045 [Streptomyces rhizosphaericola]|uniref:hypothetical protein n=1 Tax=Streptomyces rhizosphaericola TaxID=2564098 RepID=UPI0039EF9284